MYYQAARACGSGVIILAWNVTLWQISVMDLSISAGASSIRMVTTNFWTKFLGWIRIFDIQHSAVVLAINLKNHQKWLKKIFWLKQALIHFRSISMAFLKTAGTDKLKSSENRLTDCFTIYITIVGGRSVGLGWRFLGYIDAYHTILTYIHILTYFEVVGVFSENLTFINKSCTLVL